MFKLRDNPRKWGSRGRKFKSSRPDQYITIILVVMEKPVSLEIGFFAFCDQIVPNKLWEVSFGWNFAFYFLMNAISFHYEMGHSYHYFAGHILRTCWGKDIYQT
jgi:hypothetical protein